VNAALHPAQDNLPPLSFALIGRLLAFTRPYAARRNALVLLVLLRAAQLPLLAWMLGAVIGGPITSGDWRGTFLGAAGFMLFAVFVDVTFVFRMRLAMTLGEAVIRDLRRGVFEALLRQPMAFFNRTKLGNILSRVTSDIEAVRSGVQDVLFVSLVQAGQMLIAGALMFFYDRVLFGVIAAMAPIVWWIGNHFRKKLSRATRTVQESFSRVTSNIAESVGGIRVTQGFVRQDINSGIFRRLVNEHSRHNIGMARTAAVFIPLLELNSQFFIASLLVVGGWRTMDPAAASDPGTPIAFFFLANLFFSPIQVIGNQLNAAMAAMAGAERVFRILDREPEWEDAPGADGAFEVRGGIELRGVSFAYETGGRVLHDISFRVEAGTTAALVGHTGSGKTSIINLLSKFYLPDHGQIFIDGKEIRDIASGCLHRQMGMVVQQNFLFSGTVMENIRIGRPGASDVDVAGAARRLDCLDLLESLPGGLQTVVGERGTGVSLGQRQLICFCRALLADPKILLLDEATSAVDTITESRLQSALESLRSGRTTVIVAHRLSTIRRADLVLVLDRGRIVERGTHGELLGLGGVYACLAGAGSPDGKGSQHGG